MKVSDIMQRSLITVTEDTPLQEVERLIFSLGIAGVPVVRGKKLVGIVTEQDILSKVHPSMRDIIDDYTHARNYEDMEKNIKDLFYIPVSKIMNRKMKTILPDTPIMKAHSLMMTNHFSRIPIVDKNKNLIGIISQGDIFRYLLKNEIPKLEEERYASFIARHYDLMVNWGKRFSYELPSLFKLFEKEKIKSVLDLGVWTGEYTIGFAKMARGKFKVLGLDHNPIMIKMSEEKKEKLPPRVRNYVNFMLTNFLEISSLVHEKFDAAICMGNSLPYIPVSLIKLFSETSSALRETNALFVIQLLNFEKILKKKSRLLSFRIHKSNLAYEKEHLFLEFFDKGAGNTLLHHVAIFDSDGKNWIYKGITTIPIKEIKKDDVGESLKKVGFKTISFSGDMGEYQGDYGYLSLVKPFDPETSDWLNVVAKR